MVFSSVPFYLDPTNWQQQQQDHHQHGSSSENPQLPPPPPPPGGTGSIRPGSMAERARLAKVPQPETAMKCPRCDSNNTKFCYFNNYSLTQPRHFCKTCRRYWTRGGALRNVPVGGGCRRNKKSKSSSSKSPVTGDRQVGSCSGSASASTSTILSNTCTYDMMYHMPSSQPQQFPSLSSLHHLTDYTSNDIGLNFVGLQSPVASTTGIAGGSAESADQWRIPQVHQFPFMAGLEPPQGLYAFDGENMEHGYATGVGQIPARPSGSGISRFASVKMEDNHGLNLSRQFLGIPGNDQYWSGGGNAWTDLSGFTSSSTSNLS